MNQEGHASSVWNEFSKSRAEVLNWGKFYIPAPSQPGAFCQCLEPSLIETLLDGGLLLASSGRRPKMLLKSLQYTGQPTRKDCQTSHFYSAKIEKLVPEVFHPKADHVLVM